MFHHQDNVGKWKVVRDCFCRFCTGLENQRRLHVRFSLLVACENQNWKNHHSEDLFPYYSIIFFNRESYLVLQEHFYLITLESLGKKFSKNLLFIEMIFFLVCQVSASNCLIGYWLDFSNNAVFSIEILP